MKQFETVTNEQGERVRRHKNLPKLLNLNYLELTNKTYLNIPGSVSTESGVRKPVFR